jgi:acyl-CoA reductase-like NAD-dependent aldehyde dehydrogenase
MPDADTAPQAASEAQTNGAAGANGSPAGELPVVNPATGEVVATVAQTDGDGVRAAVKRARAAQPAWEGLGFSGRARILRRAQKWTVENTDRIAQTIVSETGKTYEDALLAEVAYAASAFGFWAKRARKYLADEKVRTSNPFVLGRRLRVRYAPAGVIGVIGPWNYPLTNSFGDCIPALAAGNSVVLKPASITPLTSELMREGLLECGMPEDVYQVVVGPGSSIGNVLIDEVDGIMFTGSTEVGKKVMERAAQTLTPVSLELGGKDPMIVLRDADLERAANAAAYYSMQNGGQTCISVERVYVEEPVYDEFIARLDEKIGAIRQGVPGGPATVEVGAITSPEQGEIVERHVADAREKGARILAGGERGEGPGDFYQPTLIADADHSMLCMTEETFGPTLPVMKVADADEAVRLANDSPYGLQSSVWTGDAQRGRRLARRLEAGVCCVNDACINYVALELPMGGWKESGMGSRHGADGIRKYTRRQTLLVTPGPLAMKKELHMFPYSERNTGLIRRTVKTLYGRGNRD